MPLGSNAGGDADSILDDALEPRGDCNLISSSLRKRTGSKKETPFLGLSKDFRLFAPHEPWGSLFQECPHALRDVGAAAGPTLKRPFKVELLIETVGP
jgi:hypothetical protein